MSTTPPTLTPPHLAAPDGSPLPTNPLTDNPLNAEEFAALVAIDGSLRQRRPPAATEIRLRRLGLIEPSPLSRMPVRTAQGEALVLAAGTLSGGPLRVDAADFSIIFGEAVPA
jgi:hypothetical protein